MSDRADHFDAELAEAEAVAWIVRRDRGLTPTETRDLADWLAEDPRHAPILAQQQQEWRRLDQLVKLRPKHDVRPDRHLLRPPAVLSRRGNWRWAAGLAAAAGMVLAVAQWWPVQSAPASGRQLAEVDGMRRELADGSVVELKDGAAIAVLFNAVERRVVLERGEAIFFVNRDARRPFVVDAGGVEARAVGTAFTVRRGAAAVEVLVTEGRVAVAGPTGPSPVEPPWLEPRQRAVVPSGREAEPMRVETLTDAELSRELAWQHRLLDFTDAPLADVAREFNRRNAVLLEIADPATAALRINASIRSDNLDAFVHLLEDGLGVRVDRPDERRIVLRRRS